MTSIYHLGQVNRPVTGVEVSLHAAIEPAAGFRQQRAAGRSQLEVHPIQLVRVPTRLQAKPPNPIQVFLIDQVKGEGAAGFDQSPRMMLAG